MRFQPFAEYLESLENTSGRTEMYRLLGGRDKEGRGLALRFPRVVGFVREDKSAEDATTALEIEKMYAQQRSAKKTSSK